MIRSLHSDLPRFKGLQFRPGLNVLLAEKTPGASNRQTRNGAGKTSLVELIHFCLGAKVDKASLFSRTALKDTRFAIDLVLGGKDVRAWRSTSDANRIEIEGDTDEWPVTPKRERDGTQSISNSDWKSLLGSLMFGLPPEPDSPGGPSFRSLFPYFARRERDSGFHRPEKHSDTQQTDAVQVALTYLLGLDWTIPREWGKVRQRERTLAELRKVAGAGDVGAVIGTTSQLRSQLATAEDRVGRLQQAVSTFVVHERYHELEKEADGITARFASLSDDNVMDRRYLTELETAVAQEAPPAVPDLERLYKEAGIALPGTALRRFEELQSFHESVVRNRKSYLAGEIEAARNRLDQREFERFQLDQRRSQILSTLDKTGALESLRELEGELTRARSAAESIRQRYDAAVALERNKLTLENERNRLMLGLQQDYADQDKLLKHASLTFERLSGELYPTPGQLLVTPTRNGPAFEAQIHAKDSSGIGHMQVFCFDLMLAILCAERGAGPGFLLHDSHLFDPVDERQTKTALRLAHDRAQSAGFQYIATMNSDRVVELGQEAWFRASVLPTVLTDRTEDGGLFGFRFD